MKFFQVVGAVVALAVMSCEGDDVKKPPIRVMVPDVHAAVTLPVHAAPPVPVPPPHHPPAGGGWQAPGRVAAAPSFYERLLELRKVADVLPWLEPFEKEFPPGDAAGTERAVTLTFDDYSMLAEEMIGVGSTRTNSNPTLSDNLESFDLSHEFGPKPQTIPEFTRDKMLLGTGYSDWAVYPEGLYLPKGLQQVIRLRNVSAMAASSPPDPTHAFFGAFRGYRAWPKGQIYPVQRTYEELARDGYALEPFARTVDIAVTTTGSETPAKLKFDEDYLVEGINVLYPPISSGVGELQLWGQTSAWVQLRIAPTAAPIMPPGQWVSLPLVGWQYRRTSWRFRIPLTVSAQTTWVFTTRLRTVNQNANVYDNLTSIQVVIYGSKLVKQ